MGVSDRRKREAGRRSDRPECTAYRRTGASATDSYQCGYRRTVPEEGEGTGRG